MSKLTPLRRVALGVAFVALFASTNAAAEEPPPGPIDRVTAIRIAVSQNPSVHAAEQRAHAMALAAGSAASLPAPEVMLQIWQVPLAKPYALGDAGMIMIGLGQTFPAPGARAARARAVEETAMAERAGGSDRARLVRRDAEHAFADYVEASARHDIHLEHRTVAERALDIARARHAGGASLTDVTQAEVELARVEADLIADQTRAAGARARLNALLVRDPMAPLGPPVLGDPEIATWDLRTSMTKAEELRPELRAAAAQRNARSEEASAASREATLPSFSVAALYFAPVGPVPVNGYGANASMTLPWIWGEAASRRDAAKEQAEAARSEARAASIPVRAEVVLADTNMRAAALRLQALRDRALPASQRSFEALRAGYEAGRTEILALLMARRSVVDAASEIVAAKASLDHALAELDAAVGTDVPRQALGPLDAAVHGEAGDRGR